MGVEHLLAALEAMGVDNCRIEIEGGPEVPIDDGSSLPWVLQIQAVCHSLPRRSVASTRALCCCSKRKKEDGVASRCVHACMCVCWCMCARGYTCTELLGRKGMGLHQTRRANSKGKLGDWDEVRWGCGLLP